VRLEYEVSYARLERDAKRLVEAHDSARASGRKLELHARDMRRALSAMESRIETALSRLKR
jgi:mRNA degradation ribonuclease J1/J2